MKTAFLLLAPGFEEVEAVTPLDLLRRAGVKVVAVSLGPSLQVEGAHKILVSADVMIQDVNLAKLETCDAVILPGGQPGSTHLAQSPEVEALIRQLLKLDRWICAICAAPALVLGDKGFLKGHSFTCFPGMESHGLGAHWLEQPVVRSGRFITSRGLGTAGAFSLEVISALLGETTAKEVGKKTLILQ